MNLEKRVQALETASQPEQQTQTIFVEVTFSAKDDEDGNPIPEGEPYTNIIEFPMENVAPHKKTLTQSRLA